MIYIVWGDIKVVYKRDRDRETETERNREREREAEAKMVQYSYRRPKEDRLPRLKKNNNEIQKERKKTHVLGNLTFSHPLGPMTIEADVQA
jgi:DNA repair photolyase